MLRKLLGSAFATFLIAACGSGSSDPGAEAGTDGAAADGSKGPCDGLGCASGPGRLIVHVVDSQFMQPPATVTFLESGKMVQSTCTAGDAGACTTWELLNLGIGPHTIVVHASNALDAMLMVQILGPTGCCGMGPDVERTVTVMTLSPSSLCTSTGGTAGMQLCCTSSNDFPDLCLTGACGCAPQNSKMIQVCNCPQGKCYKPNVGCM